MENIQPMSTIHKSIYKNRYLHDVDYSVFTIKEKRENVIYKNIKISSNEKLNSEQIVQIVFEMVSEQIDMQQEYDNFDVARLNKVILLTIYDRELKG